jgi:hypothetical protein
MYILNTVGTVQILTEGTVEQLGKVSLNGIYTESDCDSAEGCIRICCNLHCLVSAFVCVTL